MRKREAIQPRKYVKWKPRFSPKPQAAMNQPIGETGTGSTGVPERGEYAKVRQAYLGGLTGSASRKAER